MAKKRADIPITATMLAALPSAYDLDRLAKGFEDVVERLNTDIVSAEKQGPIPLARAFFTFYVIKQRLDESMKRVDALFNSVKEERIPDVLELAGLNNVSLEEGYRIQTASRLYVSIAPDKREEAMNWLRENSPADSEGGMLADLIIETVNASTLSAAARHMLEEYSQDLPSELFNSTIKTTSSVNKIATPKR